MTNQVTLTVGTIVLLLAAAGSVGGLRALVVGMNLSYLEKLAER